MLDKVFSNFYMLVKAGTSAFALIISAIVCQISKAENLDVSSHPPDGCANILAYGGESDGKRDNAAAFQAAVEARDTSSVCIYFPSGIYLFSSSPLISTPTDSNNAEFAVTIKGDGSEVSKLAFSADVDGLKLELNGPRQSFHIRDLSILAGSKSETATGLAIVQNNASSPNPAQSDISGVSIRGRDGFGVQDRFARGIYMYQVSNVSMTNTLISGSADGAPYASQGTCLHMDGTHTSIPVQINIISSQINHCGRGIYYGPYLQGLQIVGSNFVGNGTAIYQPSTNKGNDQLAVIGSQFNSGQRNIFLNAPTDGVSIIGNDFYLAETGVSSIEMPGVQFAILGNCFIQLGTAKATGISIGKFMLDAGIITGNTFNNFNTAIILQPYSSRVNIQSNAYSDIKSEKVHDEGRENAVGGGSI